MHMIHVIQNYNSYKQKYQPEMEIPEIPELGDSLKKSETHSFALPHISKTRTRIPKYKTSRVSHHRSVFMDKIKDITADVKYDNMEFSNITDEQKKLKNMLRQFNNETYHILGRYIDRPIDQPVKKPRSTSIALTSQIRDREISNNQEILEICKKELDKLEKKSENLKFLSVEEFQRKITEIQDKIEEQIAVNKEVIKGNTLRGLGLKKDDEKVYHEVSDLQQQKYILELKKQRLVSDTEYVAAEQASLDKKLGEADKKIESLAVEYNKIITQQNQKVENIQRKMRLSDKRKMLEKKRVEKQGNTLTKVARSQILQGQYLKHLQMLDDQKIKNQKLEKTTKQVQQKVNESKRELLVNEHKLTLVKKGMINDKNMEKLIEQQKEKQGCKTS